MMFCNIANSPFKWRRYRYPPVVFQLATAAPKAPISEFTAAGMPPAPMNEPLMGSGSWQIRHIAYSRPTVIWIPNCSVPRQAHCEGRWRRFAERRRFQSRTCIKLDGTPIISRTGSNSLRGLAPQCNYAMPLSLSRTREAGSETCE